ncbi:MAG: hypothetical protein H6708_17110 [Kofleriaceae bacterium]|nr:hypothetical protein [Kofleriaceae bacterium]
MRISWLAPEVIVAARTALKDRTEDWGGHFTPEFEPPPAPAGLAIPDWAKVTEHVARAEHVTQVLRDQGLEEGLRRFAASPFAIEVATLAAAAHSVDALSFEMCALVLACDIDALVFYAPFLRLLVELGGTDHDRVVSVFEGFCDACVALPSDDPHWRERVGAVRDGLANVYVHAGRLDQGHALFEARHAEEPDDVAVALSASRAFLAAGAVARAVQWLDTAVARADALGRPEFAAVLRDKQASLRKRLS